MWPRLSAVLGFAAVAIVLAIAPAAAGKGRSACSSSTRVKGDAAKIAKAIGGVELADVQQTRSGIKAAAVLTASQRAKLAATGVKVKLTRNKKGLTVTQQAARQAAKRVQRLAVLGRAGRNPRRALPGRPPATRSS